MNVPANSSRGIFIFYLIRLISIGASLLLAACSAPTTISFTNFSSDDIHILFRVENNKLINVKLDRNGEIEIKSLLDKHFTVHRKNQNLDYGVASIPEEFINNFGVGPFFKRIAKAQFEEDGCIYLVAINESPSRSRHIVQPQGFPLCPKIQ